MRCMASSSEVIRLVQWCGFVEAARLQGCTTGRVGELPVCLLGPDHWVLASTYVRTCIHLM